MSVDDLDESDDDEWDWPKPGRGRPPAAILIVAGDALVVSMIDKLVSSGMSVQSACRTIAARRKRYISIATLRQRYYRAKRRQLSRNSNN